MACFRQNEHLEHLPNDNEHTVGLVDGHGTVCLTVLGESLLSLLLHWPISARSPESRKMATESTFTTTRSSSDISSIGVLGNILRKVKSSSSDVKRVGRRL